MAMHRVVAVLGFLLIFPVEAFAAMTMSLTSGTAAPGQTVDIYAMLSGGTGSMMNDISTLDATIQYDDTAVSSGTADVSMGPVLVGHGGIWSPGAPAAGIVDVSAFGFSSGANGPGELVDFLFHISPTALPGTYTLTLLNNQDYNTDITANNTFYQPPGSLLLQNGSITITAAPEPSSLAMLAGAATVITIALRMKRRRHHIVRAERQPHIRSLERAAA